MTNILIFSGSARQGNYTQHVANFIHQLLTQKENIQAEIVSPQSLGLDFSDEGTQAKNRYPELTKKVTQADAYIIVSPEYNHGYSGSLKYMLDLHLKEYIHKPTALVGVSVGPFGGTRVIENLLPVVRELGMVATFADLNVTSVQKEMENGEFIEKEKWTKRADKMIDELLLMNQALKHIRN